MVEYQGMARWAVRGAFALGACVALPVHALTYLVGAVDADCDHGSIQDAIAAAAAHAGEDSIRIAGDQSYDAQALTIGQQDLTITGGYASCAAAAAPEALPGQSTVLSGSGGAAAPVISITGSGVRVLSNLQIRNGDNVQGNGSGCGGGVRFTGSGELRIGHVGISQNDANSGGGLCATGTADPTVVTLLGDVSINNNSATTGNGGGLWIGGHARLVAVSDATLIAFNDAPGGFGGGVFVRPPGRADLGSPGLNGLGLIYANEARRGGGLASEADDNDDSCLRLFTTDATRPIRLQSNRASEFGGAIYLTGHSAFTETGDIELAMGDFVLDGNIAPNGPAMFLQGGNSTLGNLAGIFVEVNRYVGGCPVPTTTFGAVRCAAGANCNRIEGNHARNLDGDPTNGNVIEMRVHAAISGEGVTMRGNSGTRLISWSNADGTYPSVELRRSALVGNQLTQELLRAFDNGYVRLFDTTITGNTIGNPHVIRMDEGGYVQLSNLVIEQAGKLTLAHPNVGSEVENSWIVASDTTTLRPDPTLLQANSRFIDPERGDYRLRVGTQAIDYVPAPSPPVANERDLDGRARNVDLENASANLRPRDAGAYERQVEDPWVHNGDFVSDLRLWSNPNPAHATWTANDNAPGSVGGALVFNVPLAQVGPDERRTALTYCFNTPNAGDYQLHAKALVAVPSGNRDYPVVAWRLRYDSADCSGPEAASGQGFLGRSGSTWQGFAAAAPIISVDPLQWTWNTTIELLLDVAQDPNSVAVTSLYARFDEIEITRLGSSDNVFRDGFESL
jgi:hypothetical protein